MQFDIFSESCGLARSTCHCPKVALSATRMAGRRQRCANWFQSPNDFSPRAYDDATDGSFSLSYMPPGVYRSLSGGAILKTVTMSRNGALMSANHARETRLHLGPLIKSEGLSSVSARCKLLQTSPASRRPESWRAARQSTLESSAGLEHAVF